MNTKQVSVTGARQGRDSAATGLIGGTPEKTGFPFDQGLYVDPNNSKLFVTEDATAGTDQVAATYGCSPSPRDPA